MARLGRPAIFGSKDQGQDVHGVITKTGAQHFEWARQKLAALYETVMGRPPKAISDADVIESVLRGETEAKRCLKALKDSEGA